MKHLAFMFILLLVFTLTAEEIKSEIENEPIKVILVFEIKSIEKLGSLYQMKTVSENEAMIKFNGSLYKSGSQIEAPFGTFPIEAMIYSNNLRFNSWESSEYVKVWNRTSPKTFVNITAGIVAVPTYIGAKIIYELSLILEKNDSSEAYNGTLKVSLLLMNKINNEESEKFLPSEILKIKAGFALNVSIQGFAKVSISVKNIVLLNNLIVKREGQSIKGLEYLSWNYNEERYAFGYIYIKIEHEYPDGNYDLGTLNKTYAGFISSIFNLNLTLSYFSYQKSYEQLFYRYYGFNTTYIKIASVTSQQVIAKSDSEKVFLKLRLLWSDDLSPLINKEKLLSVNLRDFNLVIGENDKFGYMNFTLPRSYFENRLLFGKIRYVIQFKDNATIAESRILEIKWSKIATEVIISDLKKGSIIIRILDLSNFNLVISANVTLFIDGQKVFSAITNSNGIAQLSFSSFNYKEIRIKVEAISQDSILLSSELSDLVIYSAIYP